ncbi:N-acetyltransferase family protein [Nocardioides aestuarii]|uniref:N-acetyltransferase family protein n=1 Tax=Nocardioides aestuarii TaxID=252231 RepID=A0ABW4TTZ0_9ACTN
MFRVRDATPDDASACAAIYAPYVAGTTVSFEEEPPGPEEMAHRIAASQAEHAWLVAEDADGVLGYAYAGTFRSRAAYRHTCEVSVYVDADRRGRGVGRALYTALLDRMTGLGMRLAVGGATMPNEASERLHRALGFEVVGTFRDVGFKQDRWCDVRWFQKRLV